jgi:hypothetical protein
MAMTQEELIKEIKQLPPEDRKALLEVITQVVKEETQPRKARVSIVDRLYGIAKPEGPIPSDEELKEEYIHYLTEKYS